MKDISNILQEVIGAVNKVLWGFPVVILMLLCGLYFTVSCRFFQFTHLFGVLRKVFSPNKGGEERQSKERASPFQAFCTSLAATVGTGSVTGVASALAVGGAGAVFWMWVSALIGMMTAFAENTLGGLYRSKEKGRLKGGAMYYMEKGLGSRRLGRFFALCCVAASLGMGNMSQSNAISCAAGGCGVSPIVVCLLLILLLLPLIFGSKKRIAALCAKFVPLAAGLYIIGCLTVIALNIGKVLPTLKLIVSEAFNLRSAVGGGLGSVIVTGFCRGVFSNEAGLGSTVSIHACADIKKPTELGRWAMAEVFADTIIICTLSALVMLMTASSSVEEAFAAVFGSGGRIFVTISVILLALGTIIGYRVIGLDAWEYLFPENKKAYPVMFVVCLGVGALFSPKLVWGLADMANGIMIIPNLTAVFLLRRRITDEFKRECKKSKTKARL